MCKPVLMKKDARSDERDGWDREAESRNVKYVTICGRKAAIGDSGFFKKIVLLFFLRA